MKKMIRQVNRYDTGTVEHITYDFTLLNNYIHCKIKLRCANGMMCSFEGYNTYT